MGRFLQKRDRQIIALGCDRRMAERATGLDVPGWRLRRKRWSSIGMDKFNLTPIFMWDVCLSCIIVVVEFLVGYKCLAIFSDLILFNIKGDS